MDFYLRACGFGGKGIRTPDLLIANETLYQLSYTPPKSSEDYHGEVDFEQVVVGAGQTNPERFRNFMNTRWRDAQNGRNLGS